MYGNRNQTLFPERKQMFGLGAATAADYAGLPTSLYATPTDPTFSASGNPFDINADRNSMEFTQALQYVHAVRSIFRCRKETSEATPSRAE